jgi:putative spermidine/putrescine transport system substrate-binding protein
MKTIETRSNLTADKPIHAVDRRRFMAAAMASVAAPFVLIPGKARANSRVVVSSWGGALAIGEMEAYFKPFMRDTGIEVVAAGAPDLAKLKAQLRTNTVDVDIVSVPSGFIAPGDKDGIWAPINRNIVDFDGVDPRAIRERQAAPYNGVAGICWHDGRAGAAGKHPETWGQFWDTKGIPGRRALRSRISETLEVALMADGVAPQDVYPCDVERGFKALDRLKKDVSHWIAATPQTVSLVQSNETDFSYTYYSRVFAARAAGIPLGFSFKQNFSSMGWYAVVSKSPNPEGAQKLLSYFFRKENQARMSSFTGLVPTMNAAMALVDEKIRPLLAPVGAPDACHENIEWWETRFEELNTRFREWQLS